MKNLIALVCMTGVPSAIRFFIHTSKKRKKVTHLKPFVLNKLMVAFLRMKHMGMVASII